MSSPVEKMDLDGNTEIPLPSSTSRPTDTATKIVEQLKILIEHRKEWATKIGNAELALLNCNADEEKDLEKERDSLVKNKGILDNKIQRLEETLKMMKNVMEAAIKQQDIPGEEEADVNSKKRKKKKKRAESDLESSSAENENDMVVNLIRAGLNDEAKNNLSNKLVHKEKEKYVSVIELLNDIKTLSGPSLARIAALQQASFGHKQIGSNNNNKRSNNQNNPNKKHKSNGYYGNNQPVVYQNNNPINGYQLQHLPAMFQQQQFQQQFQQQPFVQQYPQQQQNFTSQKSKFNGFKGQNKNQNRGSFLCNRCGQNRTHNTEQCIICGKCGKKGHLDKDCKGPNYQRNGGQDYPESANESGDTYDKTNDAIPWEVQHILAYMLTL
ncbi:MAG: hypothetical protein BYD32DRAFT_475057 [Podila humilis]|nr:MAG: hypothetical protein BYD32DRAFT_475057 [Podila humilis]